jgi:hypothetical protein
MSDGQWPYEHVGGHMVARIASEDADTVNIVFQHLRDDQWRGATTITKAEFAERYHPASPSMENSRDR